MDARTEATDAELLARHAAGDGRALGELVGRHGGLVLGVARRRVGAGPDADDVTQAVFVLLARKAGAAGRSARRLGTLAPWLLATARHAARNADRRRRRRARHEREAAVRRSRFAAFASHDPSAVLIWREIAQILDDAVLALPAADRAAVVLRHFEQRPIADVAAALDVSPDAARQRVHRALVKLRGKLARRGVEVPAATLGTLLAAHATAAPPAALAAACAASAATPAALAIATGVTAMTTMKLATTATVGLALAAGTAATLTAGGTAPASTRPAAAAPSVPALGEVVEVTLHTAAEGKPTLLDLDTGRTLAAAGDVPDRREKMDLMDVAVNHGDDTPGLNGMTLGRRAGLQPDVGRRHRARRPRAVAEKPERADAARRPGRAAADVPVPHPAGRRRRAADHPPRRRRPGGRFALQAARPRRPRRPAARARRRPQRRGDPPPEHAPHGRAWPPSRS